MAVVRTRTPLVPARDCQVLERDGQKAFVVLPYEKYAELMEYVQDLESILDALARGEFYSSTGVVLEDLVLTTERIALTVEPWGDTTFRIEFIGRGGTVMKTAFGLSAEYIPDRLEGYVRVRVADSNGLRAWTQPVFLNV